MKKLLVYLLKIWRWCYENNLIFFIILWRQFITWHTKSCIILKYNLLYNKYNLYNTYNEILGYTLWVAVFILYIMCFLQNIHIKKRKITLPLMWVDLMVFSACYISYTHYVVIEAYRNKEKLTITKHAVQNIRKQPSLVSNRSFYVGQKIVETTEIIEHRTIKP